MISHKAVGLLSGGLDSVLAGRLLVDQGIEVHAVYIEMPWGCAKPSQAEYTARLLQVPFKVIPLADDYLSILKNPVYGFGSAYNPCVDCHIYMVRKAAEYMREIGASFVFTGEVLGQRPMSQRRWCLGLIEEASGIPGRLLRPLSAKLMAPTLPEMEGIVDRDKLLAFTGRNRRPQFDLAKALDIKGYATPGGGCLLTEQVFGRRIKDVIDRGCFSIDETAILGAGRYFRLSDEAFVMVGRDQHENDFLLRSALTTDIVFRTYDFPSPTAILRSKNVLDRDLSFTAGLVQFFSKQRASLPLAIPFWVKQAPEAVRQSVASIPSEEVVRSMLM